MGRERRGRSLPTFTTSGNNATDRRGVVEPAHPGPALAAAGLARARVRLPVDERVAHAAAAADGSDGVLPGEPHARAATTSTRPSRTSSRCTTACTTGRTSSASPSGAGTPRSRTSASRRRENDSVIGNAQAGAVTGGLPSYLGRDNANMVPLPDGVRPITNMYLWQPIAGAFYAPCVDGDYDMAVIGHEFGHLTENRMIGKGGTRGGHHAGAMGESFGDFSGVEYLNEYGYVPGLGREPVLGRRVRDRQQGPRDPQLRDELPAHGLLPGAGHLGRPAGAVGRDRPRRGAAREPAQLLEPRATTSPARRCTPTARSGRRRTTTSARRSWTSTTRASRRRTRPSSGSAPRVSGRPTSARATGAGSSSSSTRWCSCRPLRPCSRRGTRTSRPT